MGSRSSILVLFIVAGILKSQLHAQRSGGDSLHQRMSRVKVPMYTKSTSENDSSQQIIPFIIQQGDTIFISTLANVDISSPRRFWTRSDLLKYMRYRRCAAKVYPYAKEAIRIFSEAQMVSNSLKKRKKKKYLKKLSKQLEKEFETPLKKLSKTEGKVLVKMIERELDTSLFDLIKMTRGKFKAVYWNQSSKLYGYRLKNKYQTGDNSILDIVLQDFDISYDLAENSLN